MWNGNGNGNGNFNGNILKKPYAIFKKPFLHFSRYRFYLMQLSSQTIYRNVEEELPHCTQSNIMEGKVQKMDKDNTTEHIFSVTQLRMSLKETACLQLVMVLFYTEL